MFPSYDRFWMLCRLKSVGASYHPDKGVCHFGLQILAMSTRSVSILDHIADYLRFNSNTQLLWFTMVTSYDHGCHLASRFRLEPNNYEVLLIVAPPLLTSSHKQMVMIGGQLETWHATTSRHDERTREGDTRRYGDRGDTRSNNQPARREDKRAVQYNSATEATCNNQPACWEDERAAQDDMATEATQEASTSRCGERTRGWRNMLEGERPSVSLPTIKI